MSHSFAPACSGRIGPCSRSVRLRAASAQAQRDAEIRRWRVMAHRARYPHPAMGSDPRSPEQHGRQPSRRLDSWKEIASFLRRGIRTVQRWEREEGLPVHRLTARKRGSVYADPRRAGRMVGKPPASNLYRRRRTRHDDHDTAARRVWNTSRARSAATFWPRCRRTRAWSCTSRMPGQDGASPQVWLQQIGGAAVQLTSGLRDCAEPAFSADDTRVIFSAAGESTRNVYEIPALGGQPRVLKRAARNARFSPDGKWLAYIALEPRDTIRLAPAAGGEERTLASGLVDIASATWSDDSRHLLVHGASGSFSRARLLGRPGGWRDTGRHRRSATRAAAGLHRYLGVAPAWTGGSIFYSAAGRQGVHVWRQRISPATFEAIGEPELMTPGADHSFFPAAARTKLELPRHARRHQYLVGRAPTPPAATAYGPLRRLTRGPGIVSRLTLSQDGRTLAYFAARTTTAASCMSESWRVVPTRWLMEIRRQPRVFPAISPERAADRLRGAGAGPAGAAPGVSHEPRRRGNANRSATTVAAARGNGSMNRRCSSKRSARD